MISVISSAINSQIGNNASFFCALFVFVVLFSLLSPSSGQAITVEELGPEGGRIQSLMINLPYVDHLVCGTTEGRIYTTSDAGFSWSASSVPATRAGCSVETLITGVLPDELWAGIRNEDGSGAVWSSKDGGKVWREIGSVTILPAVRSMLCITRGTSTVLFAGTTNGLYRSDDAGENWIRIFEPSPNSSVASLAASPDGQTILLGTWRRGFRSTDGGKTFRPIWTGMSEDSHVFTFVRHPLINGRVYAATCGWVYRSDRDGDNWSIRKQGLSDRRIYSLALVPSSPELLVAGTANGLYLSTDEGRNWHLGSLEGHTILSLAIDPVAGTIYAGLDGAGIWKSTDRGRTFVSANQGIRACLVPTATQLGQWIYGIITQAAQRYGLATLKVDAKQKAVTIQPLGDDIGDPLTVKASRVRNSNKVILHVGTFRGLYGLNPDDPALIEKTSVTGPVNDILEYPPASGSLIASSGEGLFTSHDGGIRWLDVSPQEYHGQTFSPAYDPFKPSRLFIGTLIGIFRSSDEAKTWHQSSYQLPKKKTPFILSDPATPGLMRALSSLGLYMSENGGKIWSAVIAYDFPRHSSFLLHVPNAPRELLANDLTNGGLYRSTNGGSSWKSFPELSAYRILDAFFLPQLPEQNSPRLLCATSGHSLVLITFDAGH